MQILIINGPNLNMLGKREPEIYGAQSFESALDQWQAAWPDVQIDYFQSNHEGALIDRIQQAVEAEIDAMIINMGAFSHYSYAIYDALKMLGCPIVEVHISHIHQREAFRHQSVTAPACVGMISGLGLSGYQLALDWLIENHPA